MESAIYPLLAVSDQVWITAIGAAATVLGSWIAAKYAVQKGTAATNLKIDDVAEKVEVVRHATNSLTEQLVAKTEAEALSRGGVEERRRADALVAAAHGQVTHSSGTHEIEGTIELTELTPRETKKES